MANADIKLLCVDEKNHNKVYNMHDNDDGSFTVEYGRVGNTLKSMTYDISKWNTKLKEKLRKGYKDVTQNTLKTTEYQAVSDSELNTLLNAFLENSRQYVAHFTETTGISDAAAQDAQKHINEMARNIDIPNPDNTTLNAFNAHLLKLFEIIPRKMKNVNDSLCKNLDDRHSFIVKEQSLLDNLVNMSQNMPTGTQDTILDAFHFNMVKCTPEENDWIKDKLAKDGFTKYTFSRAWKVNNPKREAEFQDFLENNHLQDNTKNVKMYWHGTGTENILSILSNGLLIKPSNSSYTGSAYGVGIYNAPNSHKASGYTSIAGSYWKGGNDNVAYMFINAVIMGNQYDVQDNYETYNGIKIYNLDGDNFSSADLGYHSVYAHAGSSLKRDEAIVYNQSQVSCRFLVEFKV